MTRQTVRDELRASTDGEVRRAKERAHELAIIIAVLGESVDTAIDLPAKDLETMAVRLQGVVLAGSATLNDLAGVAGRFAAFGVVQRDFG